MKFDVLCLPGVVPPGCGSHYVDGRPADDHVPGDRLRIRCKRCQRLRTVEIRARLTGLERSQYA